MKSQTLSAAASGSYMLGGDLNVHRLGFGAMRITGPGQVGPPADRDEAIAVLRRAVELGVNFIDTAESYGPHVSEQLIAEALHPYPRGLVIATKGGFDRPGPGQWEVNCRPERLREELDGSLKRLRLDRIDLYQLHRIDPNVPEEHQFAFLQQARQAGKIRHVGLSEVNVEQIERARMFFPVASVQNRYNVLERSSEPVLDLCNHEGIAFIPWYPLKYGKIGEQAVLGEIAKRHRATPAQIALAWLLERARVMLPIPGTSRVSHLEENVAAAAVRISREEYDRLASLPAV